MSTADPRNEPGRGDRPGLVRPYVRDTGENPALRQDAPASIGEPAAFRIIPARLERANLPAVLPVTHRRPHRGSRLDWPAMGLAWSLRALGRHYKAVAIGSIAGVIAYGCCSLILPSSAPHAAAGECQREGCAPVAGLVPGTVPSRTAPARHSVSPTAQPRTTLAMMTPTTTTTQTTATQTTTAQTATPPVLVTPSPSPSPSASLSPTPSPTPAQPTVTVSYSVVQQWQGGFQGQFTIVNNGTTAISGWELSATFPGDHVDTVWDANWHMRRKTLIMTPPSYQETIPPGAHLSEHFVAQGWTTSPASCAFDGAAC